MKFRSNYNLGFRKGISLIEAVAALGVLAVITSSVLVIVDQCMNTTADMRLRRNAFEIARQNMEILLTERTIGEMSEFGVSEIYPEIEWQTTVEMFTPQGSNNNWLKAICSSLYYDAQDEPQTVELTTWLTKLAKRDVAKIEKNRKILQELEGIDGTGRLDGSSPSEIDPTSPKPTDPKKPTEPQKPLDPDSPFYEILKWIREAEAQSQNK